MNTISSSRFHQKPIWIISHMCNDPPAIRESLDAGANGIECDVQCYRGRGGDFSFSVFHGGVGFGYSRSKTLAKMELPVYLSHLRRIKEDFGSAFGVHYFDCKLHDLYLSDVEYAAMGRAFYAQLKQHLYPDHSPSRLYSLVSVASIRHIPFLTFFRDLHSGSADARVGVLVDQCDNPRRVHEQLLVAGLTSRSWYAYGSDAFNPYLHVGVFRQATCIRDGLGSFQKVCAWTVNRKRSIERLLQFGLDAVMVDLDFRFLLRLEGIANAVRFLRGAGKDRFRLASDDNPFVVSSPS